MFSWLSQLTDRFPLLTTMGLALVALAEWGAVRTAAEAHAALRALPVALTRLELDNPPLSPCGLPLRVGITCFACL